MELGWDGEAEQGVGWPKPRMHWVMVRIFVVREREGAGEGVLLRAGEKRYCNNEGRWHELHLKGQFSARLSYL